MEDKPNQDNEICIQNEVEDHTYDLLPLFEKLTNDRLTKQKYSLLTNEILKEQWQFYKDHFNTRVFAPFQFPEINDYHFYNYYTRLIPQESIKNWKDYKMKLRPGPGVDLRGQIPIPNELHLKKTTGISNKRSNNKDAKTKKTIKK